MASSSRQPVHRWLTAVGIALLVHVVLLLVVRGWTSDAELDATVVRTPSMQAFDWIAIREPSEPERREPPQEGQHVDLPAPEDTRRPDEARFLDRTDRSTEREQVAPDDLALDPLLPPTPTPSPSTQPSPTPPPPAAAPAPRAQQEAPADLRPTPEASEEAAPGEDGTLVQDEEARPEEAPGDGDDRADAQESMAAEDAGDGIAPQGEAVGELEAPAVDLRGFRPTLENMGELAMPPQGGRSDFLELPEGDRTELNAHQALYRGFFQRMRLALLAHWNPQQVMRRNDPSGALYGTSDRYTLLHVTLNADGSLRYAIVERPSGLDFLDQEALRAFEVAGPFPNPPVALQNERGHIEFRFGFMVSFRRATSRVFWFE